MFLYPELPNITYALIIKTDEDKKNGPKRLRPLTGLDPTGCRGRYLSGLHARSTRQQIKAII